MGTRCTNHVTPLYPQKLALTSPTGGSRSVGMVRSRTKATEFSLLYISLPSYSCVTQVYTLQSNHKVRHPRCVYNKLDWSLYTCLTELYSDRDMYIL